jgi:hypothetical protein
VIRNLPVRHPVLWIEVPRPRAGPLSRPVGGGHVIRQPA